ncbi:transposase, partial [Desulfatibacillum alkenivorans]
VEAMFSELDRKTGAKHLRVRGLEAVRFCVVLKVLGMNIFRATRYRRAKNGGGPRSGGLNLPVLRLLFHFKEQIVRLWEKMGLNPGGKRIRIDIRCSSPHFRLQPDF